MTASSRNHALDNLRGIMMWLGVVLHVAVNHMQAPSMLPWKDSQSSPVADLILILIHAFRMPVFFMLAGFFVARMVEQRGHVGMLKNRLRRIGLPLLVFWPMLALVIGILAMMFVHLMQRGVVGFDPGLMPQAPAGQSPIGRMHLWFMFDLLWLYGVSALLIHCRRYLPGMGTFAERLGRSLLCTWWGLLLLTAPLALIGTLYPNGIMTITMAFTPNLPELAHYGLFYAAGWVLYTQREAVLPRLQRSWVGNALIGLFAFVASLAALKAASAPSGGDAYPALVTGFLYSGTAWCWSLALIGAFTRYTRRQSPWMSYLSESSYWVYLVHMLGTIGFGVVLYNAPLGFMAKMLINVTATTLVSLLSYQLFVRHSWLGAWLGGRSRTVAPVPA